MRDEEVYFSSFILPPSSLIYQAPEVVQSRDCEPRQAGNGATVAVRGCAAATPEPDQILPAGRVLKPLSLLFVATELLATDVSTA